MAKRLLSYSKSPSPTASPKKSRGEPLSPGNITTTEPHANVQALVTSISPIKPQKFFDGELTDGETIIRFVGFDKSQRLQLLEYCEKGVPVALKNCQIQQNKKYPNKLEVVLKSYTKVEHSDANFSITDPKTIGSPIINLNQLETLHEYDRATVKITALKVNEPQVVSTGKTKQEVVIADATAKSTITLWESDINMLSEAKSYQLNRMGIHSYLGKYTLTSPEMGLQWTLSVTLNI